MSDVHTAASGGRISTLISDFVASVSRFLARARTKSASWLRQWQLARMKSILMRMSDDHLAQIGIKRSEISQYARKLVEDEQDS